MTNYRGRPQRSRSSSHPRTNEGLDSGRMNGSACDNFIQDSLALGSAREGGASRNLYLNTSAGNSALDILLGGNGMQRRGAAPRTGIPSSQDGGVGGDSAPCN